MDSAGRIRLDDREMRPDVQAEVSALFPAGHHGKFARV
jgi:trans-2-enoyl-CoA reductase